VSGSAWRRELAPRAQNDLRRLDPKSVRRILDAIDRVVEDPDNATGVVKLAARPEFRLRVGNRRVLFIRDNKAREIRILRVRPRGDVYDR
jgi:mRNA-degrading endonuclease RelE of RelBE toxin-antitoxin system